MKVILEWMKGMILIDFWNIGYGDEPFVMTCQAYEVFYVKDPTFEHWSIVLHRENKLKLMKRI